MKKILIVLAMIAGSAISPARANASPYPLAGTWQIVLTGGDLQSMAYEPLQNFLWEFELFPSGAYDIHIYAYGFDGKPVRIMTQSLNAETPRTGSLLIQTNFTDNIGTVTQVNYDVRFDFNSKTVQGRYAKTIFFGSMGFTSQHYGSVFGRRLTPDITALPQPVPKTPDAYEEESKEHKECIRCSKESMRACTKARNVNQAQKQRNYWNKICNQECKACEGSGC